MNDTASCNNEGYVGLPKPLRQGATTGRRPDPPSAAVPHRPVRVSGPESQQRSAQGSARAGAGQDHRPEFGTGGELRLLGSVSFAPALGHGRGRRDSHLGSRKHDCGRIPERSAMANPKPIPQGAATGGYATPMAATCSVCIPPRGSDAQSTSSGASLAISRNWNRAAELARQDYVKFLCHDDVRGRRPRSLPLLLRSSLRRRLRRRTDAPGRNSQKHWPCGAGIEYTFFG